MALAVREMSGCHVLYGVLLLDLVPFEMGISQYRDLFVHAGTAPRQRQFLQQPQPPVSASQSLCHLADSALEQVAAPGLAAGLDSCLFHIHPLAKVSVDLNPTLVAQ